MTTNLVSQTSLRLTTAVEQDVATILVEGELDIATSETLQAAIDGCLAERPRVLAIDMSGVTFLGSAGATTVLECWYRATKQRTRMGVVDPSKAAGRVLEAMRLHTVLVRDPSVALPTSRFL